MLSATPVNNRFADLKNQLALAYGDDYTTFNERLETSKTVEVVLANAQKAFNEWSKLPREERKAADLMSMIGIDFSILLDNITIARSRKHITKYYDTSEIGKFPTREKPISYYCDIAEKEDTLEYNDIFNTLTVCISKQKRTHRNGLLQRGVSVFYYTIKRLAKQQI